ncbi:Uncharacterised protein [Neisseria meningitidis]|nr:Uncharacterised protein [Neisseria meningitidis]CWS54195.1 Uncharacterised protein [Neisseria meningitidis]
MADLADFHDGFDIQTVGMVFGMAQHARLAQNQVAVAARDDIFCGIQPIFGRMVLVFTQHQGNVQASGFIQYGKIGHQPAAQIQDVRPRIQSRFDMADVADAHQYGFPCAMRRCGLFRQPSAPSPPFIRT